MHSLRKLKISFKQEKKKSAELPPHLIGVANDILKLALIGVMWCYNGFLFACKKENLEDSLGEVMKLNYPEGRKDHMAGWVSALCKTSQNKPYLFNGSVWAHKLSPT